MSDTSEMERLEQFVEKLLGAFAELRAENKRLVEDLNERNALIGELQGDISSQDMERSEISLRVTKLIDQIEEWELTLEKEQGDDDPQLDSEEIPVEDDGLEKEADDEDSGGQGNLFSLSNSAK